MMLSPPALPEALAHWRYTPDEWRDFTDHEGESNRFELSDLLTKYLNFVVAGAAVLLVVGAAAGGIAGAAVVLAMVGGFFLLVTLLHRAARASTQRGLEARAGEVLITRDGVCTNGMWFGWGPRDPAWRLRVVRRGTAPTALGKTMGVLEFKCVGSVSLRGGRVPVDKEWRVPVPAGREAEADAVVTRLLAAQHAPPDVAAGLVPGGQSGLYGHDFAGDVCRRCGSTVEAVSSFKWGCQG